MTDLIEIITWGQLMTYLGLEVDPPGGETYVELANGLVSEVWANPVTPIPYWVKAITLEAAGRPARNPKGLASWSRSIDDGSRTERLPDAAAKAGVFLTPAERQQLEAGVGGTRRRRFGTVRTFR